MHFIIAFPYMYVYNTFDHSHLTLPSLVPLLLPLISPIFPTSAHSTDMA